MTVRSGLRLNLMLGSAMLAVCSPAYAKTAAAPAPAADDAAAPAAAPADQSTIGEIIVTATKRETNLQKTPISISVLNSEALQDRHVQSLFNLADGSVPSLRIATFEARQSALTVGIRGIVPYDQNQTARDAGVGVYIDGVVLGKTQGLNAALFDIERIEVLKGPQGTIFGRNTEGGALSLVTRAPSGVLDGRAVGGVGNYGSRNAELHLDLPSFYNISLKLDGVYQHQDPTVKDPLAGSTGWNYYDRVGGRIAARWKPFDNFTADVAYDYAKDDNTPQFSQLLSYNPNNYTVGVFGATSATNGTPRLFLPGTYTVPGTGTPCGGTIAAGAATPICIAPLAPANRVHTERQLSSDFAVPQQPSEDITHGASINLKWKAADWIELRSITAWRGVSTDQWDNSGGAARTTFQPQGTDPVTGNPVANTGLFSRYSLSFLRQHQFSQEFQAVGSFPQFDYVVGAYYFQEHATEYAATPLSNQYNTTGTGYIIRSPIFLGTINSGNNSGYQPTDPNCNNLLSTSVPQFTNSCQFITRASEAYDHTYSFFGNVVYSPDWLQGVHLTLGGRYTHDQRRGRLYVVNNNYISGVFQPNFVPFTFANSLNRFDPLINLSWDATRDLHFYAKYATGFRAGGANDRSQQFNSFGPESVKSYEIGAKMDFFEHRARLNVAGYIMDRKNTQFDFDQFDTQSGSPTNGSHIETTQNAGKTKIRGIEADLTVKPIANLTLGASYAYTYWKAPAAVNPLTGGPLQQLYIVYTPKHAASGSIDYEIPLASLGDAKIRFHLDGNYASSQYSFQLEPTKTDSSFVVNGRLALADIAVNGGNKVTLSVWSRNLFDTTYIYRRSAANSSPVLNYCGSNGLNGAAPCTPNALISTNYGGILGDYGNLNPPRTFGFEASMKF
ncbi:TonB-dependent receptor [Sphingomonas sp. GlSt437]|uniref:TonB-dependent receptor n=1 Tax=Sphingomonas sp. GlSt437 TaxID=3389970 RepID=UPI003A8B8677